MVKKGASGMGDCRFHCLAVVERSKSKSTKKAVLVPPFPAGEKARFKRLEYKCCRLKKDLSDLITRVQAWGYYSACMCSSLLNSFTKLLKILYNCNISLQQTQWCFRESLCWECERGLLSWACS